MVAERASTRARLPRWKKALFAVILLAGFLVGLELVLAVFGVRSTLFEDDPYVGFTSHAPLFVRRDGPGGAHMATAPGKLRWFCPQRFASPKPAGAYRIFCMGGSTTFGRPYGDRTSFCGWLRELLPVADPSREWELINAGGISYASYRSALLMEELIQYSPDAFIIYTGQNEFLERLTYQRLIETPAPIRGLGGLASRTRTYSAMKQLLEWIRPARESSTPKWNRLSGEVDTLLGQSVGPVAYTRNDEHKRQVIAHFRYSLSRMVDIARSAGARVVFVTPASNLRHASPFKSEHREGLAPAELKEWQQHFDRARAARDAERPDDALTALEAARRIDDRHAGLHYLRGQVLDGLGRYAEARAAYERALVEDVCSLRALPELRQIVVEVAAERDVTLVDFAGMVDQRSARGIPGEGLFLDHVHPKIEVHRELALAIITRLTKSEIVRPSPDWVRAQVRRAAVRLVAERVEGSIDAETHGAAMRKLAMVMAWAGKFEDGYRAGRRAIELAPEDMEAHFQLARCAQILEKTAEAVEHYRRVLNSQPKTAKPLYYYAESCNNLGVIYERRGELAEAELLYVRALRLRPDFTEAVYNLGVVYKKQKKVAEAEVQFLRVLRLRPGLPEAHFNLGATYERQGRLADAEAQYERALTGRPGYGKARERLDAVRRLK